VKLAAIDANSLINRAFFAIRLLTTKTGEYTNAVYGFLSYYFRILNELNPDAVCACFDVHAPTFRHLEFEGYKAGRRPCPEELKPQFELIREVLDALGVYCASLAGFEADDLLGTVSQMCENTPDWECAVITGDRDSFQLTGEKTAVHLLSTKEGRPIITVYTPDTIREVYGVDPVQMIQVKALMGDASDNIPGVAGVGEKTALGLIRNFGSVDGVYAHLDDKLIKKGAREKLTDGKDSAYLSLRLAEIDRQVPVSFTLDDLKLRTPDYARLLKLFERLELKKFIVQMGLREKVRETETVTERLPFDDEPQNVAEEKPEESTKTAEAAETETESTSQDETVYFLASPDLSAVGILEGADFTLLRAADDGYDEKLKAFLEGNAPKCTHDAKPVYLAALELGIECENIIDDTAVGAYLIEPGENVSLSETCARLLGESAETVDYDRIASPFGVEEEAQKLWQTLTMLEKLRQKVLEELAMLGMTDLYRQIELPLTKVLARMQYRGVLLDASALAAYSRKLGDRLTEIEAAAREYAGQEINLNSPKQLGELLFERLALSGGKKTKTGWVTDIDTLNFIRDEHPIVPLIIEYRQYFKLRSTYAEGLPKFISRKDGRIHSNFQQLVTATGRLSCTDPNLQNIPVRKSLGAELRRMFTAPEDWVLVDADYSQIELRLLAAIAEDTMMLTAFENGADIHRATAAAVAGIAPEEITPAQRSAAKAVNFGIVYGISDFSLAGDLGISRKEAKEYIGRYFEQYPGVHAYMERIRREAKEQGYVTTLYGRRRALPELKSPNRNIRAFGERVALNTPIQGTAADIIKIAMIRVENRLKQDGLQARLILQVHDELIVECPKAETEAVKRALQEEMENAAQLGVRLAADAAEGENWYDAKS